MKIETAVRASKVVLLTAIATQIGAVIYANKKMTALEKNISEGENKIAAWNAYRAQTPLAR